MVGSSPCMRFRHRVLFSLFMRAYPRDRTEILPRFKGALCRTELGRRKTQSTTSLGNGIFLALSLVVHAGIEPAASRFTVESVILGFSYTVATRGIEPLSYSP